jgi:hypothetical protein
MMSKVCRDVDEVAQVVDTALTCAQQGVDASFGMSLIFVLTA